MEQRSKPSAEFISNKTALVLIFIIAAVWALITFVGRSDNDSGNRPAVSTAYIRTSAEEFRYNEVDGLVLKPNKTIIVRFDKPGETGWLNALTHRVYFRVESTRGHATIFKNGRSVEVPPGRAGSDIWLGNSDELLEFKIKSSELQNSIAIRTGTKRVR